MNPYKKLAIALISCAICFAAGRYSVTNKSTEVSTDIQKDKQVNTHTTTEVTKLPDGTTKTVTTVDTTTMIETNKKVDKVQKQQSASKKLNVSALIGYNIMKPNGTEIGVSVSKEVLGPITAGVWGMNNGTIGLSIGLDF